MPEYGLVGTETMTPVETFAGHEEVVTELETIPESKTVRRLELMKRDGSGGIVPMETADAATLVYCLASEAVTTGVGESVETVVYVRGPFFADQIAVPATKTIDDYRDALIDKGIFLR